MALSWYLYSSRSHAYIPDEFIYQITHDRVADWLLPGVPPTGKKLSVPMVAIVNFRGDRLYNGERLLFIMPI